LPVYIIIIALIIPDVYFWGFSAKGLTLLFLYLLGILIALLTSVVFSLYLKSNSKNLFVIDIPSYKTPRWKNVFNTIFQKTKTFVLEAGKIILTISILLWALASYGPGSSMEKAVKNAAEIVKTAPELNYEEVLAAQKLEASYIGHFGHFIEPVIRPLGYDWKIGIALITSFAAREVFVGTLGTIYSVGEENFDEKLVDKMRKEKFAGTDRPVYTFATGFSFLLSVFLATALTIAFLAFSRVATAALRMGFLSAFLSSFLTTLAALAGFALFLLVFGVGLFFAINHHCLIR
jgi:ferrous iron transport protein B